MKLLNTLIILMTITSWASAETFVTVPWEEVKTLYREHIERELRQETSPTDGTYTIEEARYAFSASETFVEGKITVSGRQISPPTLPIPLFGDGLAVTVIQSVTGGELLSGRDDTDLISFLPGESGPFSIELSVICPLILETRVRQMSVSIPRALKNQMTLETSTGMQFIVPDGMMRINDKFHFNTRGTLDLRFSKSSPRVAESSLDAVPIPAVTLDTITFLSSFEENGRTLSILRIPVPADTGDNIRIGALPEAHIWSLKINGLSRQVYTDVSGNWIIPLPDDREADVELALVSEGNKLGISGRLETSMPGTGLQARQVIVGIALPSRVELVSLEADVTPDPVTIDHLPPEFMGESYFFSRSFYGGEAMNIKLSYREPAAQNLPAPSE